MSMERSDMLKPRRSTLARGDTDRGWGVVRREGDRRTARPRPAGNTPRQLSPTRELSHSIPRPLDLPELPNPDDRPQTPKNPVITPLPAGEVICSLRPVGL